MSDQTKNQNEEKELRIEDLPPKAAKPEEQDATKGGYSTIGGGLSGIILHQDTTPVMTADSSGNEQVDHQ
jgi:hypothetical protein